MSVEIHDARPAVRTTRVPWLTPVGVVGRRTIKGALIWSGVFALMAWELVNEFANAYPTAADRARLVQTMGSDVGTQAIFGPAHHLDTVAGYFAFHVVAIFGIVGGAWGLLVGTRLLRGEEDAGRWELLLAGQTTRRRATVAALGGLGVGLLTLWSTTALATYLIGQRADPSFSVAGSLFVATATVAAAAMFVAVGALVSQLAATRRQAAALAALVLGIAYLLRVVAYSTTSLRWLHWATPLGWVDELRPLTDNRPLAFLPIVGFTLLTLAVTVLLAGRRDLGASILPSNDTAPAHTGLLRGVLGLALRLELRPALGWTAGLSAGGFVLGLSARSIEDIWADQSGGVLENLGGAAGSAAYLGLVFFFVGLLVSLAGAGLVAASREEEADGHLDHLLARPVGRTWWLTGRLAVSTGALAVMGVATGVSTWAGAASVGATVGFGDLLAAGVNVVPAGVVVLGAGTLFHGFAPRLAAAAAYALVVWSFLVEAVGAGLDLSGWLLDLSVFHHIARAPAAAVQWDGALTLVALGLVAASLGLVAFRRRDLAGA